MKAHRLEGIRFPYTLTRKFELAFAPPDPDCLEAFVVPSSPPGFVLRVHPLNAAPVETTSLAFAESLGRGARAPQAIITYGPRAEKGIIP